MQFAFGEGVAVQAVANGIVAPGCVPSMEANCFFFRQGSFGSRIATQPQNLI
jgi:hypothetical protein